MFKAVRTFLYATWMLALPWAAAPAAAQPADSAAPVVVIVRVPKPWYAPQALVASRMRDTQAEYAALPGLLFKAYSFERGSGDFGGVYYWRNADSAKAWFNAAWHERVLKERGQPAQVRFFDAPVSIDNSPGGTAANANSAAVVTLVEVPAPAGATAEAIEAGLRAAVPAHQRIPGLLRKHFTQAGGRFGGVYLWRDEASARAWFTADWHAQVRQHYGADARIEWFDAPILLPTQRAENSVPAQAMILAAP